MTHDGGRLGGRPIKLLAPLADVRSCLPPPPNQGVAVTLSLSERQIGPFGCREIFLVVALGWTSILSRSP